MNVLTSRLKDSLLSFGLLCLPISLLAFSIPFLLNTNEDGYFGIFVLNYIIAVVYFFVLLYNKRAKQKVHKYQYTFLLLILFLISAYALNRCMNVFEASPVWVCILLWVLCANYVASIFFSRMHKAVQGLILFIAGISTVFFIYLSLYLLPIYGISLIGLLALGISIHAFIPLIITIYNFFLVAHLAAANRSLWIGYTLGIVMAISCITYYTLAWHSTVHRINKSYSRTLSEGTDELPAWMQIAQNVKHDAITDRILKTDLVYTLPNWNEDGFWRMPSRSLGEQQHIHDPLVVIASLFSEKLYISEEDRVKILKTGFGERHHTEERLWSGKDLTTQQVITNVRIWPTSHLAYTEKIITVFNHGKDRWANRREEAIYTFQLPEGSVVTSLSLWINGKEEKGILTTKGKADSAYKTIVGVEQRDPSVVHWQEGGRVTVRVFPIFADNNRVFKIGITSPLRMQEGQLVYDNILFDGPDAGDATEEVQVKLDGHAVNASGKQVAFRSTSPNAYEHSGKYRSDWTYSFKDPGLKEQAFEFGGNRYTLQSYAPSYISASIQDVFLDINKSWTAKEFDAVLLAAKGKRIWVYDYEMQALTADNRDVLFRQLSQKQFSLFPLFLISHPETSLLISKSGRASPNLGDLKESSFYKQLEAFSAKGSPVRLFHLGSQPTVYLSSLLDYRVLNAQYGNLNELENVLVKNRFALNDESDSAIIIRQAALTLTKSPARGSVTGPDHLQRLFAYNHVLKQYGEGGLGKGAITDSLIKEAAEANIVSPVSSLIVLETQQDYDRFGIEKSKNSLSNATLKSTGAVPEPHEWVMIILFALLSGYLFLKSKKSNYA